ncbi:hypothetical protein SAMN05421548_12521 [Paraburkholderia lycopersici]|uniref:Uncharacterized protein n=1 Tax=Paraburkholderia lycopersici TaxID=416944 RepID=A0A1G6XF18_9BURK|nr:hypothetical protein SAMN05421548_12521 [Paraburkholderia lycopersici]
MGQEHTGKVLTDSGEGGYDFRFCRTPRATQRANFHAWNLRRRKVASPNPP